MEENWQIVYTTNQGYQAEMIKDILENNDIEAILLNKQDSLYLFGEIEIYVHPEQVIRSLNLIKQWKNE